MFASGSNPMKTALQTYHTVTSPNLPFMEPNDCMSQLNKLCKESKFDLIVAHSAGCIYARVLSKMYKIPKVLINPCYNILELLEGWSKQKWFKPYLDRSENAYIEFNKINMLAATDHTKNTYGIFSDHDTTCPDAIKSYIRQYGNTNITKVSGGHRLSVAQLKKSLLPILETI
jgi:predicted esterase YcpF (UPF0227 family)